MVGVLCVVYENQDENEKNEKMELVLALFHNFLAKKVPHFETP